MKKNFIILLLSLLFCNTSFAESYYFKECKLSNAVSGDYIINFDKNVIEVNLRAIDGTIQNYSDKIKIVEQKKIVSEKIKSAKGENIYYQYFLNSKSKTVIKLQYKRERGIDMDIFKLNNKRESYCSDVKADWNKQKIEETEAIKEQEQILQAQKKINYIETSKVIKGDFAFSQAFDKLDNNYDYVYMLASVVGVNRCIEEPHEVIRINTALIQNTLNWIINNKIGKVPIPV